MNEERIYNKLDEIAASVIEARSELKAVNDRLDRLNGSVARHELKLNEIETYRAVHEKDADHDRDDLKELTASVTAIKESTKLDAKTWLKIVGIIAVTSVVLSQGSTSALGVLLKLVTP